LRLYLIYLLLLLLGAAAAFISFVLLPYGEHSNGWEMPVWLSASRQVIGWAGIAMAVYALLALRLLLLTSHEKRNRRR
jgi:hypothetical protein